MNKKDYTISIIRFISMLMIIVCHILQGLEIGFAFWLNVGVQIFLFISGFLYGNKEIENIVIFYKERLKKIFIPYLIILVIMLALDIILLKNTYSLRRIVGCFLGLGAFVGNIPILSHTWFVSYILLCYLLIPILQYVFKKRNFKTNLLCLLLIMITFQILESFDIINVETCWINNFVIGYFYGKCCKEQKQKKVFNIIAFVSFIVIIPLAIIYQENIQVTLPSVLKSHSKVIINYGHVLLGVVLFIILYNTLSRLHIKKNKMLILSDKYSYYIYLSHQIFILYSFSVLHLTRYLFINILLIFLLSILSAVILRYVHYFALLFFDKKLKRVKN